MANLLLQKKAHKFNIVQFPSIPTGLRGEIVFKKLYRKTFYNGLKQNRQRNHQKTLPVFKIKWIQKN